MPKKTYLVNLSEDERQQLLDLVSKGAVATRKLNRAHILLQAHDGATDAAIAKSLHLGQATVGRIRRRFVEGNLEQALNEAPRPGAKRKLDEKQEAFLIATACSTPPAGREAWTMQLLADRMVEVKQVDTLSDETVRRTLKKTSSSRG
jgi:transposase